MKKRFVCHIDNFLEDMRVSKLLAVTGVLLFVILLGACDSVSLTEEDTGEPEFTNVEYSENGSEVTLYLDGAGIPVTRSQRAITKDLAQAAFDFVEVIFVNGANIARASWVLGEPAKIDNVDRTSYNSITSACMFVGRNDGKVLLGVGKLTGSRNENGTAGTPATTLTTNTRSVTFTLAALQSGLVIDGESVGGGSSTTPPYNAAVNSLNYVSSTITGFGTKSAQNTYRRNLSGKTGGIQYPIFCLPNASGTTVMSYAFSTNAPTSGTLTNGEIISAAGPIKYVGATNPPVIQKRTPRYADGLRYKEPRNAIDITTTAAITSAYTAGNSFGGSVQITFTTTGTNKGIFAFNMQIPVYMVSSLAAGNNNDLAPVTWYIRTGVGSEFYSLDEGFSRGGCVLMWVKALNDGPGDLDKIEWTWFKGF